MLNSTGIIHFTDLAGATANLQIFLSFTGTSNSQSGIYNSIVSKPQYSGQISSQTGLFYQQSGSGFFGGDSVISIKNVSGLTNPTFTMVVNYEHSGSQNSQVFSSYSSGATANSGFCISTTHTLSPAIEYYSNTGPALLMSQNNFGDKNSLWITKNTNSLSIEYFNFNSRKFESEIFPTDDTYFLPSNNWLLGGSTGTPAHFSGNNYRGFIDNFIYFSPCLSPNQKNIISSGLFTDVLPATSYVTSVTTSGITGFLTGQTMIFSGVAGTQNQISNYTTELCFGGQTSNYQTVNLTGAIYEDFISGIYQTVITYSTGYSGSVIIENTGYRKSFSMDAVSYLNKNVNSGDFSEMYYYSGVDKTNINNVLVFDRILNKYILPATYDLNQINFYSNGVAVFGSGYSVSGNLYNTFVTPSGSYFVSGNYLSGDNFNDQDSNIIDYISGNQRVYFPVSGFNSGILISGTNSGYAFYINGIKSPPQLSFDELFYITGSIGGNIFSLPLYSGSNYTTGTNNLRTAGFSRGVSQVFCNGVRQKLGKTNDYIELGSLSLLNSGAHYLYGFPTVYNNENNYFEYL